MFKPWLGRLIAVALGACLCAPAAFSQSAKPAKPAATSQPVKPATTSQPARPAATGPWAKVPASPTACYTSQDNYFEQNDAAMAAVQKDHYRQNDINQGVRDKFNEAQEANPMAMAQAMQQAMMSDPQGAQKWMERMMAQGQAAQTGLPAELQKEQQFEAEAKTLKAQYKAALNKALAPGNARWTALKKKYGLADDAYGPGELGVPDWVWVEWGAILREWDRGYEANCATWWSATGPIHGFLNRYKTYLIQERIPYEKKNIDDVWLEQYRMMNISTAGYRTTTDYEAVENYLTMARGMFEQRNNAPRCADATDCS